MYLASGIRSSDPIIGNDEKNCYLNYRQISEKLKSLVLTLTACYTSHANKNPPSSVLRNQTMQEI